MPASDAQNCDPVDCPTPVSACQQSADITQNLCRSIGQCKTTADCTTTNRPIRTACGTAEVTQGRLGVVTPICNGMGACLSPTVSCFDVPNLTVTANSCCHSSIPPGTDSGEPEGPATGFSCEAGSSDNITIYCDSQNDCSTDTICCANDAGNFNFITCQESCAEVGTNDPFGAGTYRVCRSPGGGATQCPAGRACNRTHPRLPNWGFCALP